MLLYDAGVMYETTRKLWWISGLLCNWFRQSSNFPNGCHVLQQMMCFIKRYGVISAFLMGYSVLEADSRVDKYARVCGRVSKGIPKKKLMLFLEPIKAGYSKYHVIFIVTILQTWPIFLGGLHNAAFSCEMTLSVFTTCPETCGNVLASEADFILD